MNENKQIVLLYDRKFKIIENVNKKKEVKNTKVIFIID